MRRNRREYIATLRGDIHKEIHLIKKISLTYKSCLKIFLTKIFIKKHSLENLQGKKYGKSIYSTQRGYCILKHY
jgi:hypothetical protein